MRTERTEDKTDGSGNLRKDAEVCELNCVYVFLFICIAKARSTPTHTLSATPTDSRRGQFDEDDDVTDDDADMAAMDDGESGNNTGLAIGITLAVMAAVACTAAILYRRKRRGKKSSYITFGNPSYSREHLPANDFSLDSPLTLSSNGYTVLA